jgi:glycosyltransferase involved in cell wall biosynthesis
VTEKNSPVAVLLHSLSRNGGGVSLIARRMSQEVARLGSPASVLSLADPFSAKDLPLWSPLEARVFPVCGPAGFGYSPALTQALEATPARVAHVHGLWTFPGIAARRWSERHSKPLILSIHGMLDPWALANSRWKKRLSSLAYENRNLRHAACLQVNSLAELDAVRRLGLVNPVAVIPNGVDLPSDGAPRSVVAGSRRQLLFLGRIHPKKGIREALQAWAATRKAGDAGWRFVIAGWDQKGHESELTACCDALGLKWSRDPDEAGIVFHGPAFGEEKERLLRTSDAFILSSFSEGLPMAVLEAWAHRLPVLMTEACNLPGGFSTGAALRLGRTPEDPMEMTAGLRNLFEMNDRDLAAMGNRGHALVARQFLWPAVARQMKEVYDWTLGQGPRPSFVHE